MHKGWPKGKPRGPQSADHRAKMSATKKKNHQEHPGRRAKEKNPNWKGGLSQRLVANLITREEYNKIFEKQNGLCAICGKPESIVVNGKVRNLAVDHNHVTGEFRGLLCTICNYKLGHLEDIEFIVKARIYLESN